MPPTINPLTLRNKILSGYKARPDEIEEIVNRLIDRGQQDDFHNLLYCMALICKPKPNLVALAESYLGFENDDWTIRGAIFALCDWWELSSEYKEILMQYLDFKVFTEFFDSGLKAFDNMAKLVTENGDIEILKKAYKEWQVYRNKESINQKETWFLHQLQFILHSAIKGESAKQLYDNIDVTPKTEIDFEDCIIRTYFNSGA